MYLFTLSKNYLKFSEIKFFFSNIEVLNNWDYFFMKRKSNLKTVNISIFRVVETVLLRSR